MPILKNLYIGLLYFNRIKLHFYDNKNSTFVAKALAEDNSTWCAKAVGDFSD